MSNSANIKYQISNIKLQDTKTNAYMAVGVGQTAGINTRFDLGKRTTRLGESVLKYCKSLRLDAVSRPVVSQIVRSATSIGANYSEANNASSKKDFRNKVYIAKKEAQETEYWLNMLKVCFPESERELGELYQEVHELILILQSIVNKVGVGQNR